MLRGFLAALILGAAPPTTPQGIPDDAHPILQVCSPVAPTEDEPAIPVGEVPGPSEIT